MDDKLPELRDIAAAIEDGACVKIVRQGEFLHLRVTTDDLRQIDGTVDLRCVANAVVDIVAFQLADMIERLKREAAT